jgi:hypothetical protein
VQVTSDIERLTEVKATEKTALFRAEQLPEKVKGKYQELFCLLEPEKNVF